MKKILAIIGVIVGLVMVFYATTMIDLGTTYLLSAVMLLMLGLIITIISGMYLLFDWEDLL